MQFWHPDLLPQLPSRLLSALHRDICLLRSSPWRSPKSSATWFYNLPWDVLIWYHTAVLKEMRSRKWEPSSVWYDPLYRGSRPRAVELAEFDSTRKELENIFVKTCPYSKDMLQASLDKWISKHRK